MEKDASHPLAVLPRMRPGISEGSRVQGIWETISGRTLIKDLESAECTTKSHGCWNGVGGKYVDMWHDKACRGTSPGIHDD